MRTIKISIPVLILALLIGSCHTEKEDILMTPFSYRPNLVILPINALNMKLSVYTEQNANGYRIQRLFLKCTNVYPRISFDNISVDKAETQLKDAIECSKLFIFDESFCVVYLAGVSDAVKIYADTDIAGYSAGEDISGLFTVSPISAFLCNVKYPDMAPLRVFGDRDNLNVKVPVSEYFVVGTSPLMGVSFGCVLSAVEGYEMLMEQIFAGSLKLYVELPVTGINSDGEEEARVLMASINAY
ncbi:MAG: hypothetical protein IJS30_01730 [Bacteroidales bacterium]|nr:hypothetical protein [Bacteroidales bacterium]